MSATERLDQWAALDERATPGPWTFTAVLHSKAEGVGLPYVESQTGWPAMCQRSQDAAFIAASREAAPALIAALRAVLAARGEWAREPDARMDKGWAVAVIDRAITSALGVQP